MKLLLFTAILFLISCTTLRSRLNALVGQDKSAIVQTYGPPENTASDGRTGTIYAYSRRIYQSNQFGSIDKYRLTMFFIDRHDKVYRWLVKDEPNPPRRIDLQIYTRSEPHIY